MTRLRTRLDRLLRLRDQELQHRRQELDASCEICESANRSRSSAEAEAHAIAEQNRTELADGWSGFEARSGHAAAAAYSTAARRAEEQHAEATRQVGRAEGRVTLAWRRLRALEILRARRLRAEALQAERKSQRELDEIGRRGWQEREQ